ncbi:MAG: sigma-70 family RNA polymerase sigma factor, partial [Clostridiales bacterium]|nr:sigma-70 family RNA polymerase sigma factor [Clostridiales bacterium]
MEREQLNRLLVENMKPIFGYALTRLGNVREAEELTSDILLRLLQSADRLEADERFFGFLWKTAEHAYYEFLREKSRERDRNTEYAEEIAADPVTPEDALVRQEELGLLRRELSLLSERTRRATVLYYLERKSCSDI